MLFLHPSVDVLKSTGGEPFSMSELSFLVLWYGHQMGGLSTYYDEHFL